jgi:AcrR family transcriptional regulator/predicted DNA-binding transcriptional regulator AlpA
MKISELCISSGLSKPTITNYLKIGLLPPPLKVSSKMHLFDESHIKVLLMIRRFREEEGLSLLEIKDALASGRSPVRAGLKQASQLAKNGVTQAGESATGKRDLIIDKAIRLFSTHGYENVKISDITDAIPIGKGTFYLYFKDKKELLNECVEEIRALLSLSESREDISKEPDIVIRMRNRWINFQTQHPHFGGILQLVQSTAHSEDPVIRKKSIESYNAVIKPVMDDLRRAQQEGIALEMDPEIVAYAIIGIMENITFRLNQDNKYSIEMGAKAIEDLFRRILTPRS